MHQKATSIIQKELGSAEDYDKLTLEETLQAFSEALNVTNVINYPGVMKHVVKFVTGLQTGNRDYFESLNFLTRSIMRDCEAGFFMCPACEQIYPMNRYNTTDDPLDEFCVDCQEAGAGT